MSGHIYCITNTLTGDIYIGMTTKPIERRFNQHKWYAKRGGKTHLGYALRKYGEAAFAVSLLETTDALADRERYWVTTLAPSYNMTLGGEGTVGYTHTTETKDKIRAGHVGKIVSEATRNRMSLSMAGHTHTTETKHKMSMTRKGRPTWSKGKRLSDLTKAKMSAVRLGRHRTEDEKEKIRIGIRNARERRLAISTSHCA